MHTVISNILGVKEKIFGQLHLILTEMPKWETTTLNPAMLGVLRGELMKLTPEREPGDTVIWVAGKSVAAEMDEIWRESRGEWTHPIKDFYDSHTPNKLRSIGSLGMLCGANVVADDQGYIFRDMFMCVLIRNNDAIAATGRFITPYDDGLNDTVIELVPTKIAGESRIDLKELIDMPDPMLSYNFDIYSVSAEESIARLIGTQKVRNPQFMALRKFEAKINPDLAESYRKFGIDISVHELRVTFHDMNFDQEQLDARTAFMNSPLSQLVFRQFNSQGDVVRYLVFDDLTPKTVKIKLDGASNATVALRHCTWLFKSFNERKEFPGEL